MKLTLTLGALSFVLGFQASAQQLQIHADDGNRRYNFGAVAGFGAELSLYDQAGAQRTRIGANSHTFFNIGVGGGNVGIGTTSPTSKLQIHTEAGTIRYSFSAVDGSGAELSLYDEAGNQRTRLSSNSHTFFNLNGGNVGIGTTNPTARFQIFTTGGSLRYNFSAVDTDGAELSLYDAAGNQRTRLSASSNTFFNLGGGNVGIGIAQPAHPLHMQSGAHVTAGGAWENASDRNLKENFTPVDGIALLEGIENLPISMWNYKTEGESIKHIGPSAQDFHTVFGLGSSDTTISTIDPAGISLAAIQQLSRANRELASQNAELAARLDSLEAALGWRLKRP